MKKIIAASGIATSTLVISVAQAADLPVKAKSEEYVKICSTYGPGFFYIPGADTCIKVGGYVRADTDINAVATFTPIIVSTGGYGLNGPGSGNFGYPFRDSDDNDYFTRSRGLLSFDTRSETDYGTLRSLIRFGLNWDSQQAPGAGPGTGLYFERAFIQFAGFTFGYTQSFFDLGVNYFMTTPIAGSFTWTTAAAYTAQFGNGLSATLSLEDAANRTTGVQMAGTTPYPLIGISTTATGLSYASYQAGQQVPDIVANLRLDQQWGSLLLSGALHEVNVQAPSYAGFIPGTEASSQWGWALGAGFELKLPTLAAGDSLAVQANYAQGAANYLGLAGTPQARGTGMGIIDLKQVGGALTGTGGFYPVADAVATSLLGDYALTSGWAVQASLRHFWTPMLRSALGVAYAAYQTPQNIVAAYDFNTYQLNFNTTWSPVKNLDIAVEASFTKVDGSVPLGSYTAVNASGALQASLVGGSADLWSGGVRVQRNF